MKKFNSGFTLVELIVTMAIYSILLLIISSSIVNVAKLTNQITSRSSTEEAEYIESIIKELWIQNNGEITLDNSTLLEINGNRLYVESGILYYHSSSFLEISSHKDFIGINRKIENEKVIFEIVMKDSIKRFILHNLVGNKYEE